MPSHQMQINNIKNLTFFQLHDGSNYGNNRGNYRGNLYRGRPSGGRGIGVPSQGQKDNGII